MLSFDTAPSGQFNSRPYRTYFSERRLLFSTKNITSDFQTRKGSTLMPYTMIQTHHIDGHILCPFDHVLRNGSKHPFHHRQMLQIFMCLKQGIPLPKPGNMISKNPEISYLCRMTSNFWVWGTTDKQGKLQLGTCYNMADITYRTQFYENTTHAPQIARVSPPKTWETALIKLSTLIHPLLLLSFLNLPQAGVDTQDPIRTPKFGILNWK
jgi:hypothetical protein